MEWTPIEDAPENTEQAMFWLAMDPGEHEYAFVGLICNGRIYEGANGPCQLEPSLVRRVTHYSLISAPTSVYCPEENTSE